MTSRRRMMMSQHIAIKGSINGVVQDSWKVIGYVCRQGKAQQYYSVGDYKPTQVGSEIINFRIAKFSSETRSDGKGAAPITWVADNLLNTGTCWNSQNTTSGGWENCYLRNYLQSSIFSTLPADLQQVVVKVNKSNSGSATTSDTLWIPSQTELQYKVYQNVITSYKRTTINGSAKMWWTRSIWTSNCPTFVDGNGKINSTNMYGAYNIMHILLCFCT